MRALRCNEYGPPGLLVVEHIDDPVPGVGEVVIDVHACSVGFPDLLMIQGQYQVRPPVPFTPGSEISGLIASVGADVGGVEVGDAVFGYAPWGGMAERVALRADAVTPVPAGIELRNAAAFLYAFGTSYHALVDRGHLRAGETLLVLGAAGGVGLAAVELGHAIGAEVIAAASTDEKLEVCLAAGAAHGIDYSTEDLRERLKAITGGRGVDVVFDAVGGPFTEPALRSMNWAGRLLIVGFAAGEIPRPPLNLPLLKGCSIIGVFWGDFVRRCPERHRANVETLMLWWAEDRIHPRVYASYPLEQAHQGFEDLAERRVTGKALVVCGPDPITR